MDDPVDHRRSDGLVSEDAAPPGEGQVAGEHERGVFVAGGDELEEEVRGVLLDREVADLIDLCGYPHRSTYAEPATMPRTVLGALLFGYGAGRSARGGRACVGIVAG